MPCHDITEEIRIVLDKNGCLRSYRLNKKTCGGAVGTESLLLDRVAGWKIDDFFAANEFSFQQEHLPESHVEEFLNLKHFMAIKSALNAYAGNAPAGVDAPCSIAGISYDSDDIVIEADIDISLVTEQIKACAHCGPG